MFDLQRSVEYNLEIILVQFRYRFSRIEKVLNLFAVCCHASECIDSRCRLFLEAADLTLKTLVRGTLLPARLRLYRFRALQIDRSPSMTDVFESYLWKSCFVAVDSPELAQNAECKQTDRK